MLLEGEVLLAGDTPTSGLFTPFVEMLISQQLNARKQAARSRVSIEIEIYFLCMAYCVVRDCSFLSISRLFEG